MNAYVRAVGSSALQGLSTGLWVASGGLSPAKRRVARAGLVVGAAAAFYAGARLTSEPKPETEFFFGQPEDDDDDQDLLTPGQGLEPEPESSAKRALVVLGASLAFALAGTVGGRLLERRWLARLQRKGHPHPHRALGVRIGAISGATALASDLTRLRGGA